MHGSLEEHPVDATFAWMIGGGLRTDELEPNARNLSHLMAIRSAQRAATDETSPLARIAGWFGYQPVRATADPISMCCSPA
jgi:hypothetical protein